MPKYVIKVARESGEYVWWSDITESPLAIGDRKDVQMLMVRCGHAAEAADERFDRADRTGTSAMWPSPEDPAYGFDDDGGFIVEQRGFLPRHLVGEYARLRLNDDPAAFALLKPFDDSGRRSAMTDNLATMRQTAGFYANTREERQAARLALAEACARIQASLDDLKTALDAAGLLPEDK